MRARRVRWGWLAAAAIASAAPAAVLPPVAQLQYSADVGANIVGPGRFAARTDYVVDDLAGHRARVTIPGLPPTANLRDFHIETNGDRLFCLDIGATLGGTFFRPADVIRYANGAFSKAFDAGAALVPADVRCDGVARSGAAGALLLSFDRTFRVGALVVVPGDVISVAGARFGAKVLDARAAGIPDRLNVDAVDSIASTTDLLVSFDSGGAIGATVFTAADVVQIHLADASVTPRFALLGFSDRWATANLDGLATAPNGDTLFHDGFE